MVAGILFLIRRRKQIVLGIIIDHGLREDLVLPGITGRMPQSLIHKGQYLIHVQIHSRNLLGADIGQLIHPFHDLVINFLQIVVHLRLRFRKHPLSYVHITLYSIKYYLSIQR